MLALNPREDKRPTGVMQPTGFAAAMQTKTAVAAPMSGTRRGAQRLKMRLTANG
jgi:hypothetical protein